MTLRQSRRSLVAADGGEGGRRRCVMLLVLVGWVATASLASARGPVLSGVEGTKYAGRPLGDVLPNPAAGLNTCSA
jgi:hypothetical protein